MRRGLAPEYQSRKEVKLCGCARGGFSQTPILLLDINLVPREDPGNEVEFDISHLLASCAHIARFFNDVGKFSMLKIN